MEYFKIVLVLLALCACTSALLLIRLPRSDDEKDDDVTAPTTTQVPLGIASVKSRAIAMDRGLCRELSRYHPHYPRCQEYCAKLNHWMGMCRRESCHCYS